MKYPGKDEIDDLVLKTNKSEKEIKLWFANKRYTRINIKETDTKLKLMRLTTTICDHFKTNENESGQSIVFLVFAVITILVVLALLLFIYKRPKKNSNSKNINPTAIYHVENDRRFNRIIKSKSEFVIRPQYMF